MRDRDQAGPVGDGLDDPVLRSGDDAGAGRMQRADEPEMLDVARHDLVLRAELEPRQDDVAPVRRRAGEGDLLRLDGQERGASLARTSSRMAERAGEVRLAAAALRQVDELLREHRLDRRPRERSVRACVQVREVVEYRESGACLVEGRRQGRLV